MNKVLVEVNEGVATVTLCNPERRNAIDHESALQLVEALSGLNERQDVGAVVVTGAPPAFCAGADLSQITPTREGLLGIYDAFLSVARCSLPTIAAVNGPAVGAGMNLALVCDIRLASLSAWFDSRFLRLGLHPGGGHAWLLSRAAGIQATTATVLFGERITAREAEQCGLVWRVVDDEELLATASELAGRAARLPRDLLVRAKATTASSTVLPNHESAVEWELEHQLWSFAQRPLRAQTEGK